MRYFKLVNKVGFYILKNYYKWMKPYGKHPERVPFETRYNRFRKFLKVFNERVGVSLYVKGKENIPNDVCFFAPNHQGFLDPLMLVDIVDKPTSFVGKVEVQKYPFVNYAFKGLDGLFLERDNLRTSIKIIRQVEQSLIADEKSWGIFPEGTRTRNKDFELNDFHAGTFKIALDSKKPIVPVAIFGTSRVLDPHLNYNKYPVQVSFLKPILYDEYKDMNTIELAKMVENIVREEVYRMRDLEVELFTKENPNNKLKKLLKLKASSR